MKGNQQKMREALVLIAEEAEVIEAFFKRENAPQYLFTSVSNIINLAREYHSIPLRQCDMGTAEEQEVRFKRFCESHWSLNNTDSECAGCPLNEIVGTECEFAWMQMPYEAEEGGMK